MCKCMHVAFDCGCPVASLLLEHCASMRHVAQKMLHKSCHAKVTSALPLQTSLPWPSECCLGLVRVLMKLSELSAHVPEEHISLQVHIVQSQCCPRTRLLILVASGGALHFVIKCKLPPDKPHFL